MRATLWSIAIIVIAMFTFCSMLAGQDDVKDRADPPRTSEFIARGAVVSIQDGRNAARLVVASPAVKWHNHDYHLVEFGSVEFKLGENDHLTATLHGGALTFDDVRCTIHLAVFDPQGNLLGTASIVEDVPRVWLGVPMLMFKEWTLDFGQCACYQNVASVSGAVTHGKALTPDDWQE